MSSKQRYELLQVGTEYTCGDTALQLNVHPILPPTISLEYSLSILKVLAEQGGVVFARPAIVSRGMYAGRGIIAPNSEFCSEMTDFRGYLPVEWWIMSCTEAKNAIPLLNEGMCWPGGCV